MNEKELNKPHKPKENISEKEASFARRDFLKGLATIPVLGAFAFKYFQKKSYDDSRKKRILEEMGLKGEAPAIHTSPSSKKPSDLLRIGIIGNGGRGQSLLRAAGFATQEWINEELGAAKRDKMNKTLETFLNQEDLNLVITGVCDLFNVRADLGIAASTNEIRPGGGTKGLKPAKRFRHYQELLDSPDIDAVIIATPDHWHARQVIDAVKASKHIYCEKCMTRTEEEVFQVVNAVKESNIVFQLGHQNHQQESHIKAQEIIEKGILGNITLIECSTNRNSPNGAWYYEIDEKGTEQTIDWDQFQEPAPNKVPFSPERFFRWRCWFDYGTGLSGDLLSHEFAAVNQIMALGVPETAVASGGIYFFNNQWKQKDEYKMKEMRDVPDVFNVVFEYPKKNLTLIYSATLANGRWRTRKFMGHDATMQVGDDLTIQIERESTTYKDKIEEDLIDTSVPLFSYTPGAKGIDAITSATERYFASKGLMYTYRGGKPIDTTHLHVKDWIDCIRNNKFPRCHIDLGFEEAIACHMATKSYLESRKVQWNPALRRIV